MQQFTIEQTNDDKDWDEFLLRSCNKNILCHSIFINSLKKKYTKFFIKKNKEIFGSFFLDMSSKTLNLSDELIYTPLTFNNFLKKPTASINTEKFDIINTFKDFLIKEFKKINFISDYHLNDLRPFYWHNFDKNKKIFNTESVSYTSILDLEDIDLKMGFKNSIFYKNLSVRVRQQYNYSHTRKKYFFEQNFDKKIFEKIINKTFKRQNLKPDFDINLTLNILEKLNKHDFIKMYYTTEKNNFLSFVVFGHIKDNALYLHGGRSSDEKNDYSLTFTLLEGLLDLKKKGIKVVDLEGVNSPKRGFNKFGYGGKLKPYYQISN